MCGGCNLPYETFCDGVLSSYCPRCNPRAVWNKAKLSEDEMYKIVYAAYIIICDRYPRIPFTDEKVQWVCELIWESVSHHFPDHTLQVGRQLTSVERASRVGPIFELVSTKDPSQKLEFKL